MASLLKGSKAFVNGQWVEAASGKTFEVKNPANGEVIASVPDMTAADVNVAIDAADKVRNIKSLFLGEMQTTSAMNYKMVAFPYMMHPSFKMC